jgi:hypothetical protein
VSSTYRCRSIVNHCQKGPDHYLLKEIRGSAVGYFLEPNGSRVRKEFAEEAIRSGFLIPRDRDLFNESATWVYTPKPAPNNEHQNSRGPITRARAAPR